MPGKKNETEENKKTELVTKDNNFLTTDMFHNSGLKIEKPFSHEIFLLHTQVNGLPYVRGVKKLLKALKEEEKLKLIREPNNEYDGLAILVKNQDGKKIGYVPRVCNEVIARLMDAGKMIYAKVDEVYVEDDAKEDRNYDSYYDLRLYIDIYMND